ITRVYRDCVALLTTTEPNAWWVLSVMCICSVSCWTFYIPFFRKMKIHLNSFQHNLHWKLEVFLWLAKPAVLEAPLKFPSFLLFDLFLN
uniref:Uncharacterized protein n=1 Tax=Peromyscus maniculatus bairdii TaxID=230844 RepID=A0A8C8UD75_PERMB